MTITVNMVYAFDADDPKQANTPLWQRALEPPAPLPDVNIGPTFVDSHGVEYPVDPSGQPTYRDIANEVGILSTPVLSLQVLCCHSQFDVQQADHASSI